MMPLTSFCAYFRGTKNEPFVSPMQHAKLTPRQKSHFALLSGVFVGLCGPSCIKATPFCPLQKTIWAGFNGKD